RSQPIQPALPDADSRQYYHINCPRCGADNRNWLFISENIEPLKEINVVRGGIIFSLLFMFSIVYLLLPLFSESIFQNLTLGTLILDLTLVFVCLLLAGGLPLIIVPGHWQNLRNYQLTRRFLPMLPEPAVPHVIWILVLVYIVFLLAIPGIKFGLVPVACQILPICEHTSIVEALEAQTQAEVELRLWAKLLYSGTLTSIVSSIFAGLAVNEIVSTVNRHLPNPIYANTSSMVRVALWEAKRALEINAHFQEIQWTLTRRNDLGGIDMEGVYRDPPEILDNGRLNNEVRRQVYSISTDRWCVILNTRINDDMGPRPAGGMYYAIPIPRSEPIPIMQVGRVRY
ncbi:MAG: hypothetical protein KC449_17880, partial [Anaerolineales bacterium]|nr:hypothetical protein [Anaerolineales bacterium]